MDDRARLAAAHDEAVRMAVRLSALADKTHDIAGRNHLEQAVHEQWQVVVHLKRARDYWAAPGVTEAARRDALAGL